MNVKDYIEYLPNFLPLELCAQVLSAYSNSKNWKTHSWYNPKEDTFKNYANDCEILNPLDDVETGISQEYVDHLYLAAQAAVKFYCEKHGVSGMIKKHTYPRLNRYKTNTHMSPHFDHIQSIFDGKDKGIPILSVIGNLNRDYEGGELLFFRKDMLRLNVGDLVVFPSNFIYTHEITPVEKGTRFSYVCWSY